MLRVYLDHRPPQESLNVKKENEQGDALLQSLAREADEEFRSSFTNCVVICFFTLIRRQKLRLKKERKASCSRTNFEAARTHEQFELQEVQQLFLGRKRRRRSSLHKAMEGDALGCAREHSIQFLFRKHGESILWMSAIVCKVNRRRELTRKALLVAEKVGYFCTFIFFRRIRLRSRPAKTTLCVFRDIAIGHLSLISRFQHAPPPSCIFADRGLLFVGVCR